MPAMPMFPLGTVLFPHMPLRLRVFEERYLRMLAELVRTEDHAFGVVLIERGFEVGGGEQRFSLGTAAEITHLGPQDGVVGLLAEGGPRVEVVRWLPDAPYPQAEVRVLPELTWDPALRPQRMETEQLVRRALALASEFDAAIWPADVDLSDDPVAALWQLAAVAPLPALDQVRLLGATSAEQLLTDLATLTQDASLAWTAPWTDPS